MNMNEDIYLHCNKKSTYTLSSRTDVLIKEVGEATRRAETINYPQEAKCLNKLSV